MSAHFFCTFIAALFCLLSISLSQFTPRRDYSFARFVYDFNRRYTSQADFDEHQRAFEANLVEFISSGRQFEATKFLDITDRELEGTCLLM